MKRDAVEDTNEVSATRGRQDLQQSPCWRCDSVHHLEAKHISLKETVPDTVDWLALMGGWHNWKDGVIRWMRNTH